MIKQRQKYLYLSIGVLILIIAIGSQIGRQNKDEIDKPNAIEHNYTNVVDTIPSLPSPQSYTPHGTILITGNTDFATKASSEGWSGTGTRQNPYIIQNYLITGTSSGVNGIEIRSTSYYFIIRNNYINVTGLNANGIYLYSINSPKAFIQNNVLINNAKAGINMYWSDYVEITNNTILNNQNYGIYNDWSTYLNITNNVICGHKNNTNANFGAFYGMGTSHCIFYGNNISYNYRGVYPGTFAVNTTYENNLFYGNSYRVFEFSNTYENHRVKGNSFINNLAWVMYYTNVNDYPQYIEDNYFYNNSDTVMWISSCSDFLIHNNTFDSNKDSVVWLSTGDRMNVTNNLFKNNIGEAVRVSGTNDTVIGNTFINNEYAMRCPWANFAVIRNNYIENSKYYALHFSWGINCTAEGNMITGGQNYGIDLFDLDNLTIRNNTIQKFASYGIYASSMGTGNKFYCNNFLHNNNGNKQANGMGVTWNNGTHGNFWLDHPGPDANYDGIMDTAYTFTGGSDPYPLEMWYGWDLPPEILSSPSNINYEAGTIGHNSSWKAMDDHPVDVKMYIDSVLNRTISWISRTAFNVSVDNLNLGAHNVTLIFSDQGLQTTSKMQTVTVVDTIKPNIIRPVASINFNEGSVENYINWSASDLYPSTYTIERNKTVFASGTWSNGNPIKINITGLMMGTYNFTLKVRDTSLNLNQSMILVHIYDVTPPQVNQPVNITYEFGNYSNAIIWFPSDNHPDEYGVLLNGNPYVSGTWTTGSNVTINHDGFTPGVYNFTIFLWDTSLNWVNDTVFVTVLPDSTIPTIDHADSMTVNQYDPGYNISWVGHDLNPLNYVVYLDNVSYVTGTWEDNHTIQVPINTAFPGVFNYTLILYDITAKKVSETVWVMITPDPGTIISHPSNITYEEGYPNHSITWIVTSNTTGTYKIFNNGVLVATGNWINQSNIIIDIDGNTVGLYNFSIQLNNTYHNIVWDEVQVNVTVDQTCPLVNNEPNIEFFDNSVGYFLSWTIADLHPKSYVIYLNGSIYRSGTWTTNTTVEVILDAFSPGIYLFSLNITDLRGNNASDVVKVTIIDITAPILQWSQNIQYELGNHMQYWINWSHSDENNGTTFVFLDGSLLFSYNWIQNGSNSWNVSGLGVSIYNYTIAVVDLAENVVIHSIIVNVIDSKAPVIISSSNITYELGSTAGYEITWTYSDENNGSAVVRLNGIFVSSNNWARTGMKSINVSELSMGIYNYTIAVTDLAGNIAYNTILVTVVDTITPDLTSSGNITYEEGSSNEYWISWSYFDRNNGTAIVLLNGIMISSRSWVGNASALLNVSSLSAGTYNYTIFVIDLAGNVATSTILVTVTPVIPSSTTSTGTTSSTATSSGTTSSIVLPNIPPTQGITGAILLTVLLIAFVSYTVIQKKQKNSVDAH